MIRRCVSKKVGCEIVIRETSRRMCKDLELQKELEQRCQEEYYN